jgi:Caspase domain
MKIGIALAVALTVTTGLAQAPRLPPACRDAIETINRTREILADPSVQPARLEELLAALELRSGRCPTSGDVWYYRSVLERRLKRPASDSAYSLNKAREYGSAGATREAESGAPPSDAPTPSFDPAVPVRNKWALVVGVGTFSDTRVRGLDLAAKDARDLGRTLANAAVGRFAATNVHTLVNADATLVNIKREIGWLRAQAGPDDLVLIFLASHGSPRESDPNGVSYILAHDTDTTDAISIYATSLQMIDLVENISRDIRANRVVLVLDTCFSGGAGIAYSRSLKIVREPSTNYNVAFKRIQAAPGRAVIASSRADEESFESRDLQNGYFTHFLVDGLGSRAVGPSLKDLFAYVESKVSTTVRAALGVEQHPVLDAGPLADRIDLRVAPAR